MKWAGLFLALFVVSLFVSPLLLSADVILMDQEWTQLLSERENFKTELSELKTENESIKTELKDLKIESTEREKELISLRIQSEIRTESLTTLKTETTWNNVKWFIAGLGFGFAGGEAVGIKIGIALD